MVRVLWSMVLVLLLAAPALSGTVDVSGEPAQPAVESGMCVDGLSGEELAKRGCCSWHGGVCGCRGGRAVCCDGTLSPTCGCQAEEVEPEEG